MIQKSSHRRHSGDYRSRLCDLPLAQGKKTNMAEYYHRKWVKTSWTDCIPREDVTVHRIQKFSDEIDRKKLTMSC